MKRSLHLLLMVCLSTSYVCSDQQDSSGDGGITVEQRENFTKVAEKMAALCCQELRSMSAEGNAAPSIDSNVAMNDMFDFSLQHNAEVFYWFAAWIGSIDKALSKKLSEFMADHEANGWDKDAIERACREIDLFFKSLPGRFSGEELLKVLPHLLVHSVFITYCGDLPLTAEQEAVVQRRYLEDVYRIGRPLAVWDVDPQICKEVFMLFEALIAVREELIEAALNEATAEDGTFNVNQCIEKLEQAEEEYKKEIGLRWYTSSLDASLLTLVICKGLITPAIDNFLATVPSYYLVDTVWKVAANFKEKISSLDEAALNALSRQEVKEKLADPCLWFVRMLALRAYRYALYLSQHSALKEKMQKLETLGEEAIFTLLELATEGEKEKSGLDFLSPSQIEKLRAILSGEKEADNNTDAA